LRSRLLAIGDPAATALPGRDAPRRTTGGPAARGFTLVEVMVAMVLLSIGMTALIAAFVSSGQIGVLGRRQNAATTIARSIAGSLQLAPYSDPRLANVNPANDATIADPSSLFAQAVVPSGANAPDATIGTYSMGGENFYVYVNVSTDVDGNGTEQGKDFAVVVRYHVGTVWARTLVQGYRYNPAANGGAGSPL
jgi:prepilin-type N-terminal cleavage/methylation domain-containing protein